MGFTVIGVCIGGSSYLPALLIRRYGVRATLLLGTALVAGGLGALALTNSLAMYFLGAGLCGVGYQTMALIPANHVLTSLFRRRSSVLGLYFTISSAMSAGGPLAVLSLLHLFNNDWLRHLWLTETVIALVIGSVCALVTGGPAWLERAAAALEAKIAQADAEPQRARPAAAQGQRGHLDCCPGGAHSTILHPAHGLFPPRHLPRHDGQLHHGAPYPARRSTNRRGRDAHH